MKTISVVFSIIVSLSAYAFHASAAEISKLRLSPELQRGDIHKPQGLWPLLGVGLGAMEAGGDKRTGGVPGHIKVLGSYYFNTSPVIADIGVGMHNQVLTQNGSDSDSIQSLYTEFAGRYQLSNRWQLGAIWNTLVDNPDRYRSNTNNLASFVGVQGLKEFAWQNEYIVRAGGRVMTDVGLRGDQVSLMMAELQVSFGGAAEAPVAAAPIAEPTPASAAVAPHLDRLAVETYVVDPGPVHFASDSTKLVKKSDDYFKRLARVLAANHELFERVEVVGHADQRGPDAYNDKLSVKRAQAVSSKLVAAGVRTSQIETKGQGKRKLLSHSMTLPALQKNRRVELEFKGVKNQLALKNLIDSVTK